MDLFAAQEQAARQRLQPLAVRMRPRTLDEFIGQEAFLGPGKLLRRLLEADRLTSAIFVGPPGCGKTTLARVIANRTQAAFEVLHAAEAGVKDVRRIIEEARGRLLGGAQRTVLFLDEIHRFNKAQQDSLLQEVEEGLLILLGATTENPYFAMTSALLSRSHVFRFQPLSVAHLEALLSTALHDAERGLGRHHAVVDADALRLLAESADGDARRALSALETAVLSQSAGGGQVRVTRAIAAECVQRALKVSDAGDAHYDVTSAFIKSLRGSDPDAALYWLARLLEGGDDPRFIARRIAICASEDVGNADPQALLVAAAAAQVVEFVGLPECSFALAHAATYVACAPKSPAVTRALSAAIDDVRNRPLLAVPDPLRDSRSVDGRFAQGPAYVSPHSAEDGFVPQAYLPEARRYYNPTQRGEEGKLAQRLAALRARSRTGPEPPGNP